MRQILWVVLGLAVIVSVLYWFQGQKRTDDATVAGAVVRLTNRPPSFCPERAWVVAIKTSESQTVHYDSEAVVAGCDAVRLPAERFSEPLEYQIFVSIDGAKAFRVVTAGPIDRYVESPIQIGDTNADNVINEIDLKAVQASLGKKAQEADAADVDNDNEVTILDHSLVVTNQGAGVARPDGKLWSAL